MKSSKDVFTASSAFEFASTVEVILDRRRGPCEDNFVGEFIILPEDAEDEADRVIQLCALDYYDIIYDVDKIVPS
jgi:hypothetical protein